MNSEQGRDFFSGAYSTTCPGRTVGFFSGVKRPRREVNHKRLSDAEVKNKGSYTSALHICRDGVNSEKFTVFSLSTE